MTNSEIKSYKDLIVWQKSMELVTRVYQLSEKLPKSELYGLTSQLRRAAVSVPANIAEGSVMGTKKHYQNYLRTAYGSNAELETLMLIAVNLEFIDKNANEELNSLVIEVQKMLNVLIRKLSVSNKMK